jgi:hypothetical protein
MKNLFRINAKHLQLIFENCNLDLTDILQHIQFILLEKNLILRSYIIISKNHNIEAFIILNRRINLFDSDIFEIDFGDIRFNPTIQTFYPSKRIKKFIKKNKFITNIEELKHETTNKKTKKDQQKKGI